MYKCTLSFSANWIAIIGSIVQQDTRKKITNSPKIVGIRIAPTRPNLDCRRFQTSLAPKNPAIAFSLSFQPSKNSQFFLASSAQLRPFTKFGYLCPQFSTA